MIRASLATAACLGAMACMSSAFGVEEVVKNDSLVDGGTGSVVGGFIQGEEAAVRLVSPCDGDIVAVQILWLNALPGAGQTLEQAIYIYEEGVFPNPGTELVTMEGPVMTPGYLNEFRHLDEAQTIPLSVPVTEGQAFYVSFEFYNAPNILLGDASVVRDTDGCTPNANAIYAIPGGWTNFCTYAPGDFVIRAVIDCEEDTGACCYATGVCEDGVRESDCLAESGAEWYFGFTCADITCVPRGACCRNGGCLQNVEEPQCVAIGGLFAGAGTNCDDNVCVSGACCMPATGECAEMFEFQCVTVGGDFQGVGTTCDPNPCPQPTGGCCFDDICISDQTQAECEGAAGVWGGPGSDCSDNNGNSIADICETETCPWDFDGSETVGIGDLNALLSNWGAACPGAGCPFDFDESGGVGLGDLNAMLSNWGPCP
jgi:hypothetical protein